MAKRKHKQNRIEIPLGSSREDKRARKQIIKDIYAQWIAKHPDKKIWNNSLKAYIFVKGISMNETSGQASTSYKSTKEVLRLTEILANATLVKIMPPKKNDKNQKPYSQILKMQQKSAMLVVGKQDSTNEFVQYCISFRGKK